MMRSAPFCLALAWLAILLGHGAAFAPLPVRTGTKSLREDPEKQTSLAMMVDPVEASSLLMSTTTMHLAETEAWVEPAATVLDPLLNFLSFAMLARVVLSWYPDQKISDMPWAVVALPTEPLLRVVKGFIPPAFGVDITPVFWLGIFTFVHEILLGQQGLLTMKIKYGI